MIKKKNVKGRFSYATIWYICVFLHLYPSKHWANLQEDPHLHVPVRCQAHGMMGTGYTQRPDKFRRVQILILIYIIVDNLT